MISLNFFKAMVYFLTLSDFEDNFTLNLTNRHTVSNHDITLTSDKKLTFS